MNKELDDREQVLRQFAHQLLSTLHGVQGYAENLSTLIRKWEKEKPNYFSDWDEKDFQRLQNSTESLIWVSRYAAKQVDNIAWIASAKAKPSERDLVPIQDVTGLLIKIARDFQGLARQRGLGRIRVNTESTAALNGRLLVNPELFRQAVSNLIDNAIKYSNKNSEILIDGKIVENQGQLSITNLGIPLHIDEADKIFSKYYRGKEALSKYPSGTGIGLSVSKQILETFGGTLTAQPSKQTLSGWKTAFTVSLPLRETSEGR